MQLHAPAVGAGTHCQLHSHPLRQPNHKCTDEFESDEDNTESEWEPEYVGAGLGLREEDPVNPQYSLRHSTHPLAPFPGEPLKWASYVYDDGTT